MPKLRILASLILLSWSCLTQADNEAIEIIQYQGVAITKDTAVIEDFVGKREWLGEKDDGVIILSAQYTCGDECMGGYTIKFQTSPNALPTVLQIIRAESSPNGGGSFFTFIDSFENGTVAIQDWDTDGILSGKVTGDLAFTFWYDFAAE